MLQIASASRTVYNFAEAYGRASQEEHGAGAHPLPGRLPSEREISEMMNNAEWIRNMLDGVRGMVQQSLAHERAREGSRPKMPYEDEDMPMYDGMKAGYGMQELKKRRGVC